MLPQSGYEGRKIEHEQPFDSSSSSRTYGSLGAFPPYAISRPIPYRESPLSVASHGLGPPQYAYAVRLHPSQQASLDSNNQQGHDRRTQSYDASEHMLRRKTPNGTLAAGYDGTPVQWSTEPPASKHIVLPVSTSSAGGYVTNDYWNDGLNQQALNGRSNFYHQQPHAQPSGPGNGIWPGYVGFEAWTHLPPLSTEPQALYDGAPMQQTPAQFMYNGMQIPTVLQPPYQPSLGPTASNDNGPYGPYYADGRIEAYRPAAVRDQMRQTFNQYSGPIQGFLASPVRSPGTYQPQLNDLTNSQFDQRHHSASFIGVNGQAPPPRSERSSDQVPLSSNMTNGISQNHPTRSNFRPTENAATINHVRPGFLATSASGRGAQFKEKALVWAHSVYVDLLACIHQSKKEAQQARRKQGLQRSHSQTSIYPKPPRQPAFSNMLFRHPSDPPSQGDSQTLNHFPGSGQGPSASRQRSQSVVGVLENKPPAPGHFFSSRRQGDNIYSPPGRRENGQGYTVAASLYLNTAHQPASVKDNAKSALEMLSNLCQESEWRWIDGMLLGGCLAYGLEDYQKALEWYSKIIAIDPSHVEAISNLAATLLSLNRREEAEQHWLQSVKLRPSYFEAVEHLIGLLCEDHRASEAVGIIDFVERSLRLSSPDEDRESDTSSEGDRSSSSSAYTVSDSPAFDFELRTCKRTFPEARYEDISKQPGFGSSGYAIAGPENGRMLALVHAKGNMLYALGDITGASRAFEDAVLISAGRRVQGIQGLISKIREVLSSIEGSNLAGRQSSTVSTTGVPPVLLPPEKALRTAALVFSKHGQLPGLCYIPQGMARTSAISTTSNSLLSLAKIFQDGLTTGSLRATPRPSGTGDILALYYLSLSLQPSPSTANNVGILLASIPPPVTSDQDASLRNNEAVPSIPGVKPGSGVALALAYYNYGLNLDSRHAHLYTNLGSLLKDIGQLAAAIKMYEQAVSCDGNFDIALANLANAVKDQGRIGDAIEYYKRAVVSSPDFAEAVCGLANARNSVCDWTSRGGVVFEDGRYDRWHVDEDGMLNDAKANGTGSGWMKRVVTIVGKQLDDGASWGRGTLNGPLLQQIVHELEVADSGSRWHFEKAASIQARLSLCAGKPWEGARLVRLIERGAKRAMHRWYHDKYVKKLDLPPSSYPRPQIPSVLSVPGAPTVLPFHTFTCPLSAKDIRMISQRNALRISCATLRAPWLPNVVYAPPPPPSPHLNIGYVSSDFNNHPLAHLMQSVFGMHNPSKVRAFCYATTPSDNSVHRQQIEREAPIFRDTSSWSSDKLVRQIVQDQIHILVNLNGYTRGAKNEVFAARPAPIHMSFMGFAGTLGAEWCDYLLADEMAVPPQTLRPWRRNVDLEDQQCADQATDEEDWVYSENIIFCRDTFFCCDHRQSSQDTQISWPDEQLRRWKMRKELFPDLPDNAIILGNFNQLYKIEPTTFRTWLRILSKVPKSVLWLLRFPDLGETNLKRTARIWAGEEVASRILFTDVAPKNQHISRARICDLFLDTPECNAHTTAADILWSATPLLTLPRYKYKMCSRMAASILKGALPKSREGVRAAADLIAEDEDQYEEFAIRLATGLVYDGQGFGSGRLSELRKLLYESRWSSGLFDTKRWVSDLELAYEEAWRRWVGDIGGDIYL